MTITLCVPSSFPFSSFSFAVRCVYVCLGRHVCHFPLVFSLSIIVPMHKHTHTQTPVNRVTERYTALFLLRLFSCRSSLAPRRLSSRNFLSFLSCVGSFSSLLFFFFFSLDYYNLKQRWSTSGLIGAFFFGTEKNPEFELINSFLSTSRRDEYIEVQLLSSQSERLFVTWSSDQNQSI